MGTMNLDGRDGVTISGNKFLELPKVETSASLTNARSGMIRYNKSNASFEGTVDIVGVPTFRRFAQLDANGKLDTSVVPDYVTSGMTYNGTYSPVVDDINPEFQGTTSLPGPTVEHVGDYFIIRGVTDAAYAHYISNTPTTSPVTFSSTYGKIKYYFELSSYLSNSVFITGAFFSVSTELDYLRYPGLYTLSINTDLTSFNTENLRDNETALTDGDWLVYGDTTISRLKQNRTSSVATAIGYDKSFMYLASRPMSDDTITLQGFLDDVVLNVVRRSGDSMYDNGDPVSAGGRLAMVYGTESKPALTFNNSSTDPYTNVGINPGAWTDSGTGLYHPMDGAIGFTCGGKESVRITNVGLEIYAYGTKQNTIKFINGSNENTISVLDNDFGFYRGDSKLLGLSINSIDLATDTTINGSLSLVGGLVANGDINCSSMTTTSGVDIGGELLVKDKTTLNDSLTIRLDPVVNPDYWKKTTTSTDGVTNAVTVSVFNALTGGTTTTITDPAGILTTIVIDPVTGKTTTTTATTTVTVDPATGESTSNTVTVVDVVDTVPAAPAPVDPTNWLSSITLLPIVDFSSIDTIFTTKNTGNESFIFNIESSGNGIVPDGIHRALKLNLNTGLVLPSASWITNGENGSLYHNSTTNRLTKKSNGVWHGVSGTEWKDFVIADWVFQAEDVPAGLSAEYHYIINAVDVIDVDVYSLTGTRYKKVNVDVSYDDTGVMIVLPGVTDLRFDGRLVITYK